MQRRDAKGKFLPKQPGDEGPGKGFEEFVGALLASGETAKICAKGPASFPRNPGSFIWC